MASVRTPNGAVTSYRVAWQHEGRDVYTWRTDGDEPHDFGSIEAAEEFIAAVWHDASTKAELADRDAWRVEV